MSNGTGSTENGPSSPMERLAARRAAMPPVVQDYAKQLATTIDYRVRLRQLRRTLGLTQATAARIACVDQADISKIENGGINPSVDRMNRIIARLGEYAEQRPPAATAAADGPELGEGLGGPRSPGSEPAP